MRRRIRGSGDVAHLGMLRGSGQHQRHDLVDVRAVTDAHRHPQPVLPFRAARFVYDLGAPHDAVGYAHLHVVPRQQARAPQSDSRDSAPFTSVQDDVVADAIGFVGQDGDACHQVAQGVLGSQ